MKQIMAAATVGLVLIFATSVSAKGFDNLIGTKSFNISKPKLDITEPNIDFQVLIPAAHRVKNPTMEFVFAHSGKPFRTSSHGLALSVPDTCTLVKIGGAWPHRIPLVSHLTISRVFLA
jgi:hypothetical protein